MGGSTTNFLYLDRVSFTKKYWMYYLLLESKVIHTSSYVHFHEDNLNAFSYEFANLQYSIGAELDSFFKVYCGYQTTDVTNIRDYADQILTNRYTNIIDQEIILREYDINIKPFSGWDKNLPKQSLPWWTAYDNIKHSRYDNIKDASLKNVLNLLGGLYLLEMKYLKELADYYSDMDCPDYDSSLFELKNWNTRFKNIGSMKLVQ